MGEEKVEDNYRQQLNTAVGSEGPLTDLGVPRAALSGYYSVIDSDNCYSELVTGTLDSTLSVLTPPPLLCVGE